MKLYEIDAEIMDLVDEETGEIIDVAKFEELVKSREDKLEGVALWIKNLNADAEALKAEKMAFAKRQQVAENKVESLKNFLKYALDGKPLKTSKCAVSFRRTKSVEVLDINALVNFDDSLVKYAEPTPDKKTIKARLDDGENVAGCQLQENLSIIIK